MFENLPEFSKFQKIYNDKIKEEEMKLKQADHDEGAPEKWKMKFAKDERQGEAKQKIPGKFGFGYESEDEDQARNFQSHAPTQTSYAAASTSGMYETKISKQRSPPHKPKLEVAPVPVPLVNKGPVVLDKFGNFRLADPAGSTQPPRPLEPTSSTRRSRSRSRRRSRSRSNSRSPRRRRSGSYRRRYSRSRSYSRFLILNSCKCSINKIHFLSDLTHVAVRVHEVAEILGAEAASTPVHGSVRNESLQVVEADGTTITENREISEVDALIDLTTETVHHEAVVVALAEDSTEVSLEARNVLQTVVKMIVATKNEMLADGQKATALGNRI